MTEEPQTLSQPEVRNRIVGLIGPFNKNGIELTPETTFAGDLDLDSLTIMDLVATIEDEYDIILPLNQLPDLETIDEVASAVAKIVGEG